ncbi:MAG: ABC transporter ATP-binding protein [Candidatus Caenarcaniphilales bacterium]|nr:ABC transporter ATP-binding protein [Candidatus Caenarcaniphilales bacterium]
MNSSQNTNIHPVGAHHDEPANPYDNNVIIADKLTKAFGTKTVVDDVSFQIKRGEIFGFLGPNGSGKSTVIRMLCGVLNPSSGGGSIEGIDITKASNQVRRSVGYVSQKFGLYPDLTVKQNMEFYGRVYGVNDEKIKLRIQQLCKKTNLTPFLENKAETLSGGWKQRLALACAILHEPSVLFLDEPTAGIDPVARREVWDLLFELSTEGMTMLVTTHYMDEAERCHRVGYIYMSKLIALGSIDELTALPNLYPEGYHQVVIQAEPTMKIYAALTEMDFITNVTLFGKNIHCVSPKELPDEEFKKLIIEKIEDAFKPSLSAITIEHSKASLEDVFVILTQRQAQ